MLLLGCPILSLYILFLFRNCLDSLPRFDFCHPYWSLHLSFYPYYSAGKRGKEAEGRRGEAEEGGEEGRGKGRRRSKPC